VLLEGKSVVVTGAAKGIGRAIAELFAREGARIVLADVDDAGAEQAAAKIIADGGQAVAIHTDVAREEDVQAAVDLAVASYGTLDVMINNAGIPRNAPMLEMSIDLWQSVVDVHLRGAWLGTRAAARVMCEAGRGSIVNMSSMSGIVGMVNQTNYSAAKAGIIGMTKAAAREVGARGVRVNAIAPGTIRTERTGNLAPEVWAAKVSEACLQREGRPEELASAALFLASEMSSYITGIVLEVAGGRA
jgi:3-oxoacyl-[acyl-carrier protein] reductase